MLIRTVSFEGSTISIQMGEDGALEVNIQSGENILGDGLPHVNVYVDDENVYSWEDELDDEEYEE